MARPVELHHEEIPGLEDFLYSYPLMALKPSDAEMIILKGMFRFTANHESAGIIQDEFELAVHIPIGFPKLPPKVFELGGRIPRMADFHTNASDGALCLASPVRLLLKLNKRPSLKSFAEDLIVPFLYGMSHALGTGSKLPFGELPHGAPGVLEDYRLLFGLEKSEQIVNALKLLGMKKRLANKLPCPCSCGNRTGKCKFNFLITNFRKIAERKWYRQQRNSLL